MDTAARLGTGAIVLALVFGAAVAAGGAVGGAVGGVADGTPAVPAAAPAPPPDPAAFDLVPLTDLVEPGVPGEFAFLLTGPGGQPVVAAELELSVVRRDAAGFQRPAATVGPDGVWRAPLVLPAPGVWTAFVDAVPPGGPRLRLTADLFAPGPFAPVPFAPSRAAQVGEYQVRLDGELAAGVPSPVFATVSLRGEPVTDLEPHLGAFGRLVALRRGDLARTVLGPDPAAGGAPAPAPADRAGPGIAFTALVPTPGTYRLVLEFRHQGAVRTAEFTVDAT